MLSIQTLTFNPFQENTYVLYDETAEAVIVDAGCYDREEEKELSDFIESKKLKVKALINTHSHIDHILGAYYVKDKYKIPLYVHRLDEQTLRSGKVVAQMYGIDHYTEVTPDGYLSEGDQVKFGNQSFEILFLPGHAPGHVGFYHPEQKVLMGGDVLFYRSIGRTDLPGGDYDTLIESIHKKIFTLPDDVVVYAGHGPTTTVKDEKVENPFCALTLN
ncbi:MAG TPA: MBL fold metallo-hydrolase [Cyclobacteriaceae bacterium]|nr:MBL fold metallo-hydrolase [Cyclobacteriaceae bacterium]